MGVAQFIASIQPSQHRIHALPRTHSLLFHCFQVLSWWCPKSSDGRRGHVECSATDHDKCKRAIQQRADHLKMPVLPSRGYSFIVLGGWRPECSQMVVVVPDVETSRDAVLISPDSEGECLWHVVVIPILVCIIERAPYPPLCALCFECNSLIPDCLL